MNSRTNTVSVITNRLSYAKRAWTAVVVAALAVAAVLAVAPPAQANTSVLFGTVTGYDTGLGVNDVKVIIHDSVNSHTLAASTDASGYYAFASVPMTGDYTIEFYAVFAAGNYATEYYPSVALEEQSTKVHLVNGVVQQVDAELQIGATLSGKVSFSSSANEINVVLYAFDSDSGSWVTLRSIYTDAGGDWAITTLPAGYYRVGFFDTDATGPNYQDQYYKGIGPFSSAEILTMMAGSPIAHVDVTMTVTSPPTDRLAGADRFATSARVSQLFDYSSAVFVANGLGFPDALSAAPAAAFLGAPLLLTLKDSIPAIVVEQIKRLKPTYIYAVGGTGVISDPVFNQLNALATDHAIRLFGANRYATSKNVFDTIWNGIDAPKVYLADGRNFPDALSSGAAAAYQGAPVILVDGSRSTLPSALVSDLAGKHNHDVYLIGGPGAMNANLDAAVHALSWAPVVTRYEGANRYSTAFEVNTHTFPSASTVFLAVGTGYADALSGAAAAGGAAAPLYLVPGNCVPQNVLGEITRLGATRTVLLGGTGVLSSAVANLTSCSPTS